MFLSRSRRGQVAADESRPTFFRQGALVNKTELIEHIAKNADISKAAATRALESTIGAIRTTLKKGGSVSLVGFGTFAVGKRAARTGRNPRTGEQVAVASKRVPYFKTGKDLRDRLNKEAARAAGLFPAEPAAGDEK